MNDTNISPTSDDTALSEASRGVSRRRLIRAGLSAAPVVAALKSNTVLACGSSGGGGTCIKPSAFASYKAADGKHSRWDQGNMGCNLLCPHDWLAPSHHHKTKKTKLSDCKLLNGRAVTVGTSDRWGRHTDHTLHEVLSSTDAGHGKLAKYVVACYLNVDRLGSDAPLTRGECRAIWRTRGDGWTPAYSTKAWTYADTMAYFEMLFG